MSDKIKLSILIPSFKCGGSERFVSILCNNINTNNFTVDLYVLNGETPFYQITNSAITVHLLCIKNVRKSLLPIVKMIKKHKPDILLSVSNHLNIFLCIFKFLFPKKMLLVARETSIVSINNKNSKYGKLYDAIVKRFYKNIDRIICQSAYMQNDLIKNYHIKKEKTIVIYNPVERPINNILQQNKKDSLLLITVARLSPEKGIDRLLKALTLLKSGFTFHIFGDGPDKNKLEDLTQQLGLEHKVVFEGQQVHTYQNINADLFLIGSYYEGLPNVLLEAGMLGLPVIGYNSPGGINEIISNGINGFLVDDDSTGIAFSNAIRKAIDHNFNTELIVEHTKEKFSVAKIITELENYFTGILPYA